MKRYIFGLDIGGTALKLGLFEKSGRLLQSFCAPTDTSEGGSRLLPRKCRILAKPCPLGFERAFVLGIYIAVSHKTQYNNR